MERITNECQELSKDIKWIVVQTRAIHDGVINEQENELENTLSTILTYADLSTGSSKNSKINKIIFYSIYHFLL